MTVIPMVILLGWSVMGPYHSSFSARDRDQIRQNILESYGWNIYRVWSTDWFDNPEKKKERLLVFLTNLINKYNKSKPKKLILK